MNASPFERLNLRPNLAGQPSTVKLNRILLICNDSDRAGLIVKSNIDASHKLDGKTRDDIAFTDRDLIVIQNKLERPVELILQSLQLPDGRRAIGKPSRQPHFTLLDQQVSTIRSYHELTLGRGESLVLHSSGWVPECGVGRRGPV